MNAQVNFLARRIGGVNRDCASSPKVDSNFKFGTNFPFKKNLCTGAMSEKSKILIIGGTGKIGKFIVPASARSGHPTFSLVRECGLSNPAKSELFESYKSSGVTLLEICTITRVR
ncbi:phenylcoumaran benzylic ether reductase TP7 isoform X2 [Vitis vinifera]|uniref:phenylcoumaran benzylic ether reductase TP7 isoform X2 n=1 Tax=Vitis vinifera TaxID=29760 RepID=UPI0008FFC2CB|nr:phenylcoumaran benzylic ether reductase TP7 isoform X2 [Vitis vinifera]|eukprot:XP_019074516.1 PREDICTED: isoflavone reductase homolog A622-like isoform X2 [Vitis vinifera]